MSFTLLTLPHVTLRTSSTFDEGSLTLECVPSSENDAKAKQTETASMTLAFHVGQHTSRLNPGSPVKLVISQNGQRVYSFDDALAETNHETKRGSTVHLVIPPPTEDAPHVADDIETFDHLLTQYAELAWSYESPKTAPPPLPARPGHAATPQPTTHEHQLNIKANVEDAKPVDDPALRGRLVLMDEANGDIVGELPNSLHFHEDPALPKDATASDAVVLEMQPEMYDACTGVKDLAAEGEELREAREVIVRAVPPEDQDWLMKGATLIRCA